MIKHQFLRSIVELFDKSKDPSTAANANTDSVGDYISSVSWVKEGNIVAVGDNNGVVELWDVTRSKLMRKMRGHTSRVATLDWNAHILASGKEKWLTPFLGCLQFKSNLSVNQRGEDENPSIFLLDRLSHFILHVCRSVINQLIE